MQTSKHSGPLDATTAEAINIPDMEMTEILATLGAVVYIGSEAGIALALLVQPKISGVKRLHDLVDFGQMREDLLLASFPVLIPMGSPTAMAADDAMAPHKMISSTSLWN
jgi:hypothetical protein